MLKAPVRRVVLGLALVAMNTQVFAATPVRRQPTTTSGRGWMDSFTCIGCLAAGTLIVYSGAAAWTLLLVNSAATIKAVDTCVDACVSAYGD